MNEDPIILRTYRLSLKVFIIILIITFLLTGLLSYYLCEILPPRLAYIYMKKYLIKDLEFQEVYETHKKLNSAIMTIICIVVMTLSLWFGIVFDLFPKFARKIFKTEFEIDEYHRHRN